MLYRSRKPKSESTRLSSHLIGQNVKKVTSPASTVRAAENRAAGTANLPISPIKSLSFYMRGWYGNKELYRDP